MKQTIVNLRHLVNGNQQPHFFPNVPSRPSLLIRVSGQVGTAFEVTGTEFNKEVNVEYNKVSLSILHFMHGSMSTNLHQYNILRLHWERAMSTHLSIIFLFTIDWSINELI